MMAISEFLQAVLLFGLVSLVELSQIRNPHGTPCIYTSDCYDIPTGSSFLSELQPENYICQNYTCVCNPITTVTVVTESSKIQCKKKLFQNCNPYRDICVDNAECHYSNGHQVCLCSKDFYVVKNKKGEAHCAIKKSFGTDCEDIEECQFGKFLECRYADIWSLKRQKQCLCWPSLRLHPETHKCVLTAGDYNCRDELGCVPNAICEHSNYSSREAFSQCVCKPGTLPTPEGYCFAKEGGICDNSNTFPCAEGLKCINKTCSCPVGQRYNEKLKSCDLLAGMACGLNDTCVQNSICLDDQCQCQSEFVAVDGLCELKFGQQCNKWFPAPPCNRHAHLICGEHGKCECKKGHMYDSSAEVCLKGSSGTSCEDDDDCNPNAKCDDNICVCKDGACAGDNGGCYSKESEHCTSDEIHGGSVFTSKVCEKGLACRDGICRCPVKDHQIYLEDIEECRSLVRGPCNESMSCVENADCVSIGELNECKCRDGFIPTARLCEISYGRPCTQGDPDLVCDRLSRLECSIRGVCDCGDFQYYDQDTNQCKGLYGAKCQIKDQSFCRNGWCKPFRAENDNFGVCQCNQGLHPTIDRFCVSETNETKRPRSDLGTKVVQVQLDSSG